MQVMQALNMTTPDMTTPDTAAQTVTGFLNPETDAAFRQLVSVGAMTAIGVSPVFRAGGAQVARQQASRLSALGLASIRASGSGAGRRSVLSLTGIGMRRAAAFDLLPPAARPFSEPREQEAGDAATN